MTDSDEQAAAKEPPESVGKVWIRSARDEDEAALIALIEPIFGEYDGVLFVLDEMPELRHIAGTFGEAGGQFWCAERGAEVGGRAEVVGCVGWTPCPRGDGATGAGVELKKLYVARSQRSHGLGARLTARVERAARQRGASFVELWSDVKFVTAHRFYERRGYHRDGRTRALGDASNTVEYHFCLDLDA